MMFPPLPIPSFSSLVSLAPGWQYTINDRVVDENSREWYHHSTDGIYKVYDSKKQLRNVIEYRGTKRHGIHKEYDCTGDLISLEMYVNGKMRLDLLLDDHKLERLVLFGTGKIQ